MRSACLLINHSYNASSRAQNIVVRCDCYANYTRPVSTFMQLITLPVGPPATRETLVRARRVRWEMLSRSTRALLLSHLDVYTATRWNDVGWYCVTLDWTAIRMKDALPYTIEASRVALEYSRLFVYCFSRITKNLFTFVLKFIQRNKDY